MSQSAHNNMRFQIKIILGYAILALVLSVFLGIGFYRINNNQYIENEKNTLKVAANQLVSQMDEKLGQMDASINYILSDPQILDGITILGRSGTSSQEIGYIDKAKTAIKQGINTDYIVYHCHRTVLFNQLGDVFATYSSRSGKTVSEFNTDDLFYLQEADDLKGHSLLVRAHTDPWGVSKNPEVFSLVKAIQGYRMGYIEVENKVDDLSELQVPKDSMKYMLVLNNMDLLYSDAELLTSDYQSFFSNDESTFVDREQNELIAKAVSNRYGFSVLTMESMDSIAKDSNYSAWSAFAISMIVFTVSMGFVIFISQILTSPLRKLRMVMEQTKYENLGTDVVVDAPNDEIQILVQSYQDVLERLKKSMVKEKRLAILQLQAQFDSLQAQVNPHFIYNVLNIISAKGMADNDDEICNMCGSLASMLRYSTNTKERYATLKDEVEYLKQYLYLLKSRYEYKFTYEIEIPDEMYPTIVPKMILQQLAENSVNHGFLNTTSQMCIHITGRYEKNNWYVSVADNGEGFSEETLLDLKNQMKDIKKKILTEIDSVEMGIGGMGLMNTYARCLLLYNDSLIFELGNNTNGAEVIIGVDITKSL